MTAKQLGKHLIVKWLPDGGTYPADAISIAVKSRNFKVSAKSNSTDTSVREDVLAGTRDKTPGVPDRTAQLAGLDTDETTPDWETLEVGDIGTLYWFRQGEATGKKYKHAAAQVAGTDFGSPYDGPQDWTIDFDITETPASATVS